MDKKRLARISGCLLLAIMTAPQLVCGQYSGVGTFTKITSTNDLTDGYYVIVGSTTNAMNNTNGGSYFTHTGMAIAGATSITNPAAAIVWKIETSGSGRSIYNEASAKYVSYSGTANAAYAVDAVTSDNQRWAFSYATNLFVCANMAIATRILQYNASAPRFACYTTSQQKFLLFKMEAAASTPPVLNAIGNKTVTIGSNLAFSVTATPTEGDTVTLTASNLPSGAAFYPTNEAGSFVWSDASPTGTYSVTFNAADDDGFDAETITITVNPEAAGTPPVLNAIGNKTMTVGSNLVFSVTATPTEGDTVTLTASNLPSGATFYPTNEAGSFVWSDASPTGTYSVTFNAADDDGFDAETITITVNPEATGTPPVLSTIGNQSVTVGSNLAFSVTATPTEGDLVTLTASNLPSGAAFYPTNEAGSFVWSAATPTGTYSVTFNAADDDGFDAETITITVNPASGGGGGGGTPLDIGGYSLVQSNSTQTFTFPADTLVQPGGYVIISRNATREFFESSWGVTLGTNVVFINGATTVPQINGAETFTLLDAVSALVDGCTPVSLNPLNNSIQRTTLAGDASDAGNWASSGMASATPGSGASGNGTAGLRISEYSDASNFSNEFVELFYDAPTEILSNQPPVLAAIGNKTTEELDQIQFLVSAADPADGDTITLTVSNAPAMSYFSSTNGNGTFTWSLPTPDGVHTMTFYAADKDGVDSETITITVTPPAAVVTSNLWDFEDGWQDWTNYSRLSGDNWSRVNFPGAESTAWKMEMNGISSDDWLISPPLDLSAVADPVLTYWTKRENQGNNIQVKISTNYPGTGDPLAAGISWATLPYTRPADQNVWAQHTNDLSAYLGQGQVFVAFYYLSGSPRYTRWSLDQVRFTAETLESSNAPPVLAPIGDKWLTVSNNLMFPVQAVDPVDNDPITMTVSNMPAGAEFTNDNGYGYFTWLNASPDGVYTTTFYAADKDGFDSETITITLDLPPGPTNLPALAPIGTKSVIVSNTLQFYVSASDPDGELIALTASNLPSGSFFYPTNGAGSFVWADAAPTGTYVVTFNASDDDGSAAEDVTIHVYPLAPTGTIVFQGFDSSIKDTWDYEGNGRISAEAARTDGYGYMLGGTESMIFSNVNLGGYTYPMLHIHCASTSGIENTDQLEVYVAFDDAAFPETPDITIRESNPTDTVYNATWPYSASGIASTIAGTPAIFSGDGDGGYSTIRIRIPEGHSTVKVKIASANSTTNEYYQIDDVELTSGSWVFHDPPVLSPIGTKTGSEGAGLVFTISATDPDDDPILLSAMDLPSGAVFVDLGNGSGNFTWANPSSLGVWNVTFQAETADGSDSESVMIIIEEAPSTTDAQVTIMAANITSGTDQAYHEPGIRIFQALQPDVACVQEFNYASGLRSLVDTAFSTGHYYYCEGGGEQIPNGIISKYPILSSGEWEDTYVSNRDFAWAVIDIPGTQDLYVVSIHILTTSESVRNDEAILLKSYIQANWPANALIAIAGDFNTANRTESALSTFATAGFVDTKQPRCQNNDMDTNAGRTSDYDWVLPNSLLNAKHTNTVVGGVTFPYGMVFDTRVWSSPPAPTLSTDSGEEGMQHMAVMKTYQIETASVAPTSATIYVIAGPNGSISPSTVSVNFGQNKTFTIAAATNSDIADVLVDGVSIGATNAYTFSNVTNNHSIAATFELDTPTAPVAPSNLTVSVALHTDHVALSWDDVASETGFVIWRNVVDTFASASRIATNGADALTHHDTTASVGQSYHYWVTATNNVGSSEPSASAAGRRKLSAPAGLSVSATNETEYTLNWASVTGANAYEVDVGETPHMSGEIVYSNNFATFAASGLMTNPPEGWLDSDAWTAWLATNVLVEFGQSNSVADLARGVASGGVSVGGIFAFDVGGGNRTLGVQPTSTRFAPGHITLRVRNQTGSPVTEINLAYTLYIKNDQDRANSFNCSYSTNNVDYVALTELNYTSTAPSNNPAPWEPVARAITLTNLNLQADAALYIRWSGADGGGAGSRDEFALDDVVLSIPGNSWLPAFSNRLVSGGASTSLTVTGLVEGATYYHRVRALDADSYRSDYSSTESVVTPSYYPVLQVTGTNGAAITNNAGASQSDGSDFGTLSWSVPSLTNTFGITNAGTEVLSISSCSTNGDGAAAFRVMNLPAEIAIGQASSFSIVFESAVPGLHTATVSITDNSPGSPFLLNLAATRLSAGTLAIAPESLSFGATYGAAGTNDQFLVLTNSGQSSADYFADSGAAWLACSPASGVIDGGASLVITARVSAAGLQAGASNAAITISSTAATNSPLILPVSLVVSQKILTVSGAVAESKVYDGASNTVISGASLVGVVDGDDVALSETNGYFAQVDAGTGLPVAAALAIAGEDAANYILVQPSGLIADILKADQAIVFPNPGDQLTTNVVILSATSGSGLPVSFEVASGEADVTDQTNLTFRSPGEVAIRALQNGNGNWNPANPVTNSFTVTDPPSSGMGIIGTNGTTIFSGALPSLAKGTDFGDLPFGLHVTNTLVITNSGLESLAIVSCSTNGEGSTAFRVLDLPGEVAAGAVASFSIAFETDVLGSHTASVSIVSDAPDSPFILRLAGTRLSDGHLLVEPAEWQVGATYGDPIPAEQVFLLTNAGMASVDFAVSNNAPWLACAPASGILDGGASLAITASVSVADLDAGATNTTIFIHSLMATNSPQAASISLVISQKTLTVSGAVAQHKVYDGTSNTFITGAVLEGVVMGDDVSIASTNAFFGQSTAGTNLPVAAALSIAGADASNYLLQQPAGLTADIFKADQTILFPNPGDQVVTNVTLLSASAASGLAVSFEVVSGEADIVEFSNLTYRAAGEVVVRAFQNGDDNWNAATPFTNMFIVMALPTTTTNSPAPVPLDWLEENYPGTNDYEAAAMSDTDGDGMFAWQEHIAGTIPTNALSYFHVESSSSGSSGPTILIWPSAPDRHYDVYSRTNMIADDWTIYATNIPASEPLNTYTGSVQQTKRLYFRVKVRYP